METEALSLRGKLESFQNVEVRPLSSPKKSRRMVEHHFGAVKIVVSGM